MANIMITDVCNLHCPYCFANEFVNHARNDIEVDNFKKALEFILTNPTERVGLIGGEPTTHPNFKELLKILVEDKRVTNVVLFTNGVFMEPYIEILTNPKFHILVNCVSTVNKQK